MPRLAESWKPNARRLAVDVQDPPGREVPRRQADDGGGRRGDVQPARRPRRTAPTRSRRSPACSPRAAPRRPTRRRWCSSSTRRTATSRSRPPRTTTTSIILPKGFDPATWPKNFLGTGPWKLEKYTPNVGVTYTKNPDYWDTTRPPLPDRNEIKFYEKEEAADPGHPGRRGRRARAVLAGQRQGAAHRPEHQRDRAARRRSTASCTCAPTRSRSTTSACARRSRC